MSRACIYLDDGRLFASYARPSEPTCPAVTPEPEGFLHVGASRPIVRNARSWGTVYVERDFSGLPARIAVTAAAAALMLLVGTGLSLYLAQRLSRSISGPIARLAAEARRVRGGAEMEVPDMPTTDDEVGDLVRAFQAMLTRVRDANAGLLKEIEERKKIEAQREALLERERENSRMKDEFVATVSHELRTPMSVILSWGQILETGTPNEAVLSKAISAISRSAAEQARIIDDLVDVSRITTGKLNLRRRPLDLRAAIDRSVDAVRKDADSKSIQLAVRLPSEPSL